MEKSKSAYLYLLPAAVIVIFVMLYPLVYTITVGFFESTLMTDTMKFIGLENYATLFKDKLFVGAIVNTIIWTVGSVTFQFLLGFSLAVLLHQDFVKGKTFIRIMLMIPWVLPSIIVSSIWKWMYNADYGLINYILTSFGLIESNKMWLSSIDTAMYAVVVVNIWKMFPFVLLMIEAALQGVSKELQEASVIDGASKWQTFKNVTVPTISGQCYTLVLLLTIWTLNAFTFVYNLTEGGPAHSTEVMAMYINNKAFSEFDFGVASAASTFLFVCCMSLSFLYIKVQKRSEV